MLRQMLSLAVAGATGTLSRYILHSAFQRITGLRAWWGTLAVNVLGCLLAGLVWGWFEARGASAASRAFVLVGFLGAFTTFSALMMDTGDLARAGGWLQAGGWLMLQNMLGLSAMAGGVLLAKTAWT